LIKIEVIKMKKLICLLLLATLCLTIFCGCGEKKVLHCDHCGKEIKVEKSSNMEEDWIIYCESCNEELFSDDPLLGNN